MIGDRRVVAIVPARSGSKGLPGKNLATVGGVSLLHRAIRAGQDSRGVDLVVVSSDDDAILRHAAEIEGVRTVSRPPDLAADDSAMWPVVIHALDQLDDHDVVVLLQPTSPLRTVEDVDAAITLFERRGVRSVVSVTAVTKSPHWMYSVDGESRMSPILPTLDAATRQELPEVYVINGAVYVVDVDHLRRSHRFVDPDTLASLMPAERSVDVDTALDLVVAEALLAAVSDGRH